MLNKEYICAGCGTKLQVEDKKIEGYIPLQVLESYNNENKEIYCQRCFRIRNYQDCASNDIPGEDYIKVLSEINATNALIVLIVDIFDFSGSFLPNIKRITGQNDVILAANKVDLLPQSVNKDKVLAWVKEMCIEEGLQVLDSILISSKKNLFIDDLIDLMNKYKNGRDIYIVGSSNVGKSKLVNQLLKRFTGTDREVLTVSYAPNTTLNFVGFPLDDGTTIYDTPGVLNRHQYLRYLTKKSLKLSIPQKEIKPIIYQIESEQTLFIGGLARIDLISGDRGGKSNLVFYFSNNLSIHRTKMSNADNLYDTKLYSLLTPPFSAKENLPKFSMTEFHQRDNIKYDVVISGLGFITLKAPFHVKVHAPVMVGVYIRKAII